MRGLLMFVDMMICGFLSFSFISRLLGESRFARRISSLGFILGALLYGYFFNWAGGKLSSFVNYIIWFAPIVFVVAIILIWHIFFEKD